MRRNAARSLDGVAGIKKIGVKDLSYKMVFIANSVHTGDSRFGFNGVEAVDDEGNLMSLKLGGGGGADVAGGFSRSEGSSKTPLHDRDASSSSFSHAGG